MTVVVPRFNLACPCSRSFIIVPIIWIVKTLASNLQVQRKLRKRRPTLVVQKILGGVEREARIRKTSETRKIKKKHVWRKTMNDGTVISRLYGLPPRLWESRLQVGRCSLPNSRPIMKTVCSKTLCIIRPYAWLWHMPKFTTKPLLARMFSSQVCYLFNFRNRGLVINLPCQTSSRIGAIR